MGTSIYPIPEPPSPDPPGPNPPGPNPPGPNPPGPDPKPHEPDNRKAEIENEVMKGIVFGIIACIIIFLIVLIIVWICRCKRRRDMELLSESIDNARGELHEKYGRRSTEQNKNIVKVYSDLSYINDPDISAIE